MTAAVGTAYGWELLTPGWWSPMQQFGRTSLFIYWIHVEMVYGLLSLPLHKALTFGSAWVALGVFTVLMLICSVAKDRFVGWWRTTPRAACRGPNATVASSFAPEAEVSSAALTPCA